MQIRFLFLLCFTLSQLHAQLKPVPTGVFHWKDFLVKKQNGTEYRQITKGTTAELEYFEVQAITLEKGQKSLAKTNKDIEVVIILKEGRAKCILGNKTSILDKGSVTLILPQENHVMENVADGPLTYYIFSSHSKRDMDIERGNLAGGSLALNYDSLPYTETPQKGTRKYFDRPTAMCERYEMHITSLKGKGPSHEPHQHKETEIILVTEGQAEMTIDGKYYTGGAGDLFIVESGKMHGVGNPADRLCSYFAFKWK